MGTKTPEDNGFQSFMDKNDRYNGSEEDVLRRRSSISDERQDADESECPGRHC